MSVGTLCDDEGATAASSPPGYAGTRYPVNSAGICPDVDPDGPGPEPVKGDDFAATGSLTIVQLDDGGHEIVVHELAFSDGTTFSEFTMSG